MAMKSSATIVLLLAAVRFSHLSPAPVYSAEEEFEFKLWMSQYNRAFSLEEYYHRLGIFTQNKKRIDHHNAGNHKFTMGLNHFSDMTFAEFRKSFLLTEPQNCSATKGGHVSSNGPYPDAVDWRKKGNYVTPVKNQGGCGSCWAFSTTGCLESVTAIYTGKLLFLSEQQLVDCADDFNNHGCNGGLPSQAFEYIKYNNGLSTEDVYPYTGRGKPCEFQPGWAAAYVKDIVNITKYDEMGMLDAVARFNPISFAYEVTSDFMHYREGVYSSTKCHNTTDKVNHAVLAVGYGVDDGIPYWIVKNSWGPGWGEHGYFRIERGKNMCGLAGCSSYPIPPVRKPTAPFRGSSLKENSKQDVKL